MRKPKCPSCGRQKGIPFVHGEVSDPAVIAQAERREIVLCGCAVSGTDPDWHCSACSHRWRARATKAKKKSSDVVFREMMEGLREHGLPARRRMLAAEDMADRLAPMGVFRGWAEHFLLPHAAVDPAFELVAFWDESPEAASRLEIPREIQARLEDLGVRSAG
jgi:hypothetical protein